MNLESRISLRTSVREMSTQRFRRKCNVLSKFHRVVTVPFHAPQIYVSIKLSLPTYTQVLHTCVLTYLKLPWSHITTITLIAQLAIPARWPNHMIEDGQCRKHMKIKYLYILSIPK